MKKTLSIIAGLLVAAIALSAATPAQYNRYGMRLKEKNDKVYVAGAGAYKKVGINVKELEDVTVPFKPKFTTYDKRSIKTVQTEDVIYKTSKKAGELHLMVYKSDIQNAPVAFFIHGGGWVAGKYTSGASFFKTLAGKYGITVVSIEYTFATIEGARIEDSIKDCYDGVKYILKNAKKYGIDPTRIGFFGSSAGGHLSAMCALKFPQTKAYVGWYGAYDMELSAKFYTPESNTLKREKYRYYLKDWEPKYISKVSPVDVAAKMKKIAFPSILFAGTADITIGYDNAPNFAASLKKGGATSVEVCTYENVTHSMFRAYCGDEIYQKTADFFKQNL